MATAWITHGKQLDERVAELLLLGLRRFDAYHVASAEAGGCDRLVTCDDQFLKVARRHQEEIRVPITDLVSLVSEGDF